MIDKTPYGAFSGMKNDVHFINNIKILKKNKFK